MLPGPKTADREKRIQMFWNKVDMRGENDCWLWKGGRDGHGRGHGKFYDGTDIINAHRFSYELIHGPTNLYILHKCSNKHCVNPRHLYAGTHGDNMRDGPSGRRKSNQ